MYLNIKISKCLFSNVLCSPTWCCGSRQRDTTSIGLGGLKETKNVSSPFTCKSQYCGEPPWPRGSLLGLRPPGLEFRILCLEDSVISIISQSSGGSPGPVEFSLYVHKGGIKPDSFHLLWRALHGLAHRVSILPCKRQTAVTTDS